MSSTSFYNYQINSNGQLVDQFGRRVTVEIDQFGCVIKVELIDDPLLEILENLESLNIK